MYKQVTIYTDGACSFNPGPGGFCAILIYNGHELVVSGGEKETTNNVMELKAVIEGLKKLKEKCDVKIYCDSSYVVNAVEQGWVYSWKKNDWKNAQKEKVKNVELWEELLLLLAMHNVTFLKVKGHSGDEYNEKCDKIAKKSIPK